MRKNPTRFKSAFALFTAGVMGFSAWAFMERGKTMRPIIAKEHSNQLGLAKLATQLADARKELDGKPELERQTASVRTELLRWSGKVPVGSAKVWFPDWLKEQLTSLGIKESQIRLNSEVPEPGLSGFKRTFWHVSLPEQAGLKNIPKFLLALQELDQRERLMKILDCTLQAGPDGQQSPTGGFNVEAIVED